MQGQSDNWLWSPKRCEGAVNTQLFLHGALESIREFHVPLFWKIKSLLSKHDSMGATLIRTTTFSRVYKSTSIKILN